MDNCYIENFINLHNYDIRKSRNGRWIDQKCTMDVICLVADCIINYLDENARKDFEVTDIWNASYTVKNVQDIFNKPNPAKEASNEYDKYFGQPIKLFDAAGIIKGVKNGQKYIYSIVDYDLLEYISFREKNAYNFLCLYIEKVLRDSGLYNKFEVFFKTQDKNSFKDLKDSFINFTIKYTKINGATECARIFTKVLNPLACKLHKKGTYRGHISKDVITQDMILYNQRNWRDILTGKPKSITRVEFEPDIFDSTEDKVTNYKINKAKKQLQKFNIIYRDGVSEIYEEDEINNIATQMHHIFPASDFPSIADYVENLIALTPNQHFLKAHPNNNTQYIDKDYQYICLIAKTGTIKENLESDDKIPKIYEFGQYQAVLSIGTKNDKFYEVKEMDFNTLIKYIEEFYNY